VSSVSGISSDLVSVIIPALNEVENIARTILAAQRNYTREEVEVIVADGGSTDGTAETVPPYAHLVRAPRGRAVQMNRGARASSGKILVFCHADTQLPPGWREAVIEALSRPTVSGGSFQTLILPDKGILRIRNYLTFPANWKLMFGDQAQFMSRATYDQVGGFPEIPLMEDVEMSRALHRAGRLVRIPLRVITSSRRFLEHGPVRQWLSNTWRMTRYLYLGATPEQLARTYRSGREVRT
jgi:rSAM/selenodomain-associated transferase 2